MEQKEIKAHREVIELQGVRVNNLKNINLNIPRNKLVVVTGVSGSGKSSLAFDTLYAEGQRRYVESLSSYARQFLGRMAKPDCDLIQGLPPAVAIEQRIVSRNPRSTVATSTEIYEYLRMLYARVGRMISPISGQEVRKHTTADIVNYIRTFAPGTKVYLLVAIKMPESRSLVEQLAIQLQQGYSRLWVAGQNINIDDFITSGAVWQDGMYLLLDRLIVREDVDIETRLGESIEQAFFDGQGICFVATEYGDVCQIQRFSKVFEADGRIFQEPSPEMFSFNNPLGACPECEGFGKVMGIEEDLVIPNKNLSVYEDCVACWRGQVSSAWKHWFIELASPIGFPIHRPYAQLNETERQMLWYGVPIADDPYVDTVGIDSYFKVLRRDLHKVQNRVRLAHFKGKTVCPSCRGGRLSSDALCVRLGGKNIAELVAMTLDEAKRFFENLHLDSYEEIIAKRLLTEIKSRLHFLIEVGLGYLTLDRLSNTLSGGESQRVMLAAQLGNNLLGSLYVLDEPSIGLHQRDTARLIGVMHSLRDLGNTVVVVEHDEEVMRASDYLIDIGPQAGSLGGTLVYSGATSNIKCDTPGLTAAYLSGRECIELPKQRRKWRYAIDIVAARKHNIRGLSVSIPLHILTVVTGVSGSGKSTLIRDIFAEGLKRHLAGERMDGLGCSTLAGHLERIKHVVYVDQNNLSRNSRSNACIYLGAFDEIRKLYSEQPFAKQMGYKPSFFSFNKEGGRCEVCKGDGYVTVEMQFMADVTLPCDVCGGQRFKEEALEVTYQEKNIYHILQMSVDEAINFFKKYPSGKTSQEIIEYLLPLQTVGLGYIKLGQSSSTLSGGENQRVKLAYYLGRGSKEASLFIFDEPTTGLHLHDIKTLLRAFNALIDAGHSLLVIEHNMEVIKSADWIIDLGPDGGMSGGQIVAMGTPEEVAQSQQSITGTYLRKYLSL